MFTIIVMPILGVLFGVGLIIFLLVKIIPLSVKLLRIRIKNVTKYINWHEENERKTKPQNNTKFANINHNSTQKTYWTANGWYYDSKVGKWVDPDFEVTPDPKTDIRLKQYYERRKAEGREPTYEEWKASRETEKHPE